MTTAITLSTEIRLLVYSVLVCIVMWLPYVLVAIGQFGLTRMVSYPSCNYDELPQWAQRLHRAHMNLIENLVPFAALVIVAQMVGAMNEMTALGARLFFWARLVQIAGHTAGIPWVRTLSFFVGWAGNLIILVRILWQ